MSKEISNHNSHKKLASSYFDYALWAFAGLGIEVIYAYVLEPLIYGHGLQDFTTQECIIHWTITCISWLTASFFIRKSAKKKLGFSLTGISRKWTPMGIFTSILLIGFMVFTNYLDDKALKIVHEFYRLGALKFIFQHLYYLVEMLLVTQIIAFGQNALEIFFRKEKIPYGGIVLGLTWGLVHAFTKGSVWIGLMGIVIGFLFGSLYCVLGKDFKKTYLVITLAFII